MAEQKMGRMRPQGPINDPVRGCLGKTKWTTEQAAQWSVSRIRAENPAEMSSGVRPYRCPHCRKFHIGHGW